MAPNCPNCGAHLNIVPGGDSTSTPTLVVIDSAADSPQCGQLKDANPPNPPNPSSPEFALQRLKEIMCAPLAAPLKPKQRTLRPAVSKKPDVGALTDRRSLEILDNTAWKMLAGICRAGEQSADALLEARRRGRAEHELPGRMELVFEALGAVAYDMEWTRGPELGTRFLRPKPAGTGSTPFASKARAEWYACRYVFELMLCVDYGVAIYPLLGVKGLPKSGFIRELSELDRCSRILTGVALAWSLGEAIPSSEVWDHIAAS